MVAAAHEEQLEGIARKLMEDGRSKGGQVAGRGRPKPPDSSEAKPPQSYSGRAPQTRTKAAKLLRVGEKAVDTASSRATGRVCIP